MLFNYQGFESNIQNWPDMQNSHISHFQNAEEEGGLEIQPGNSNGVHSLCWRHFSITLRPTSHLFSSETRGQNSLPFTFFFAFWYHQMIGT